MGATPLYLASILARANAYLHASATLRVSGTVYVTGSVKTEHNSTIQIFSV